MTNAAELLEQDLVAAGVDAERAREIVERGERLFERAETDPDVGRLLEAGAEIVCDFRNGQVGGR